MVWFAGKTVWSIPECLERRPTTIKALYKSRYLYLPSFTLSFPLCIWLYVSLEWLISQAYQISTLACVCVSVSVIAAAAAAAESQSFRWSRRDCVEAQRQSRCVSKSRRLLDSLVALRRRHSSPTAKSTSGPRRSAAATDAGNHGLVIYHWHVDTGLTTFPSQPQQK